MCGRFNQGEDQLNIEFKLGPRFEKKKSISRITEKKFQANISAGMLAGILTAEGLVEAEFGYRPIYDPKKLFINARVEGKGNETNLSEGWRVGINSSPAFKKAFSSYRCIIPVESYIEGPEKEKLSKPFAIQAPDKHTLFLGGIYNTYTKQDGSTELSFAILTTPANPICSLIGHHRSPMMLFDDVLELWLDPDTDPAEINLMIEAFYYEPDMVAVPLNPDLVKSGKLHSLDVIEPIGEALVVH